MPFNDGSRKKVYLDYRSSFKKGFGQAPRQRNADCWTPSEPAHRFSYFKPAFDGSSEFTNMMMP